jgi:hypothetical protein
MKLPVDEILVFGPVGLLTLVAGARRAWLWWLHRHAP